MVVNMAANAHGEYVDVMLKMVMVNVEKMMTKIWRMP